MDCTLCSLLTACYAFTGPLASWLVGRWGCRPVCVAGGLVASGGLALGSLAPRFSIQLPLSSHLLYCSLGWLLASYSVVTGIGFGLIYLPAILAVAEHFTKQVTQKSGSYNQL